MTDTLYESVYAEVYPEYSTDIEIEDLERKLRGIGAVDEERE